MEEFKARILTANEAYYSLLTIVRSKQIHQSNKIIVCDTLTLCRSNLKLYCVGRKAAFFSVGI